MDKPVIWQVSLNGKQKFNRSAMAKANLQSRGLQIVAKKMEKALDRISNFFYWSQPTENQRKTCTHTRIYWNISKRIRLWYKECPWKIQQKL